MLRITGARLLIVDCVVSADRTQLAVVQETFAPDDTPERDIRMCRRAVRYRTVIDATARFVT